MYGTTIPPDPADELRFYCIAFSCTWNIILFLMFSQATPGPSRGRIILLLELTVALAIFSSSGPAQHPVAAKRLALDKDRVSEFEHFSKVAILIGVGAHNESSGFSRLSYPAQDVAALALEMDRQGYSVRQMVDTAATRAAVRKALVSLEHAFDKDQGTLVLFFSGHGFEQNGANYLAVFGTDADDLKGEGLSLPDVLELIEKVPARRKMLFIDACRNNPLVGRTAGARTFAEFEKSEGVQVLYSTSPGGVSYESDTLKHGVFSYFLLRAIQGDAKGPDGFITFHDVAQYTMEAVRDYGVRTGNLQVPYTSGESSGEFLLARSLSGSHGNGSGAASREPYLENAEEAARDGLRFLAKGNYQEAVSAFTHAMEARTPVGEEYYYRGIAYGHLLEYSRAVDDFTKALELDGDSASVFGNRGYAYLALSQHEAALHDFNRAIELKPDYAAVYVSRSSVHSARSDFASALSDLDKAIELEPKAAQPYQNRARILTAMGQPAKALADISKSIELDPNSAESRFDRANFYFAAGDLQSALADYSKALMLRSDFVEAQARRAQVYIAISEFQRAVDDYAAVIRSHPADASAYSNRCFALAALGQFTVAIDDCNRALERQPQLAEAFNNRGYAFAGLKDYSHAIENYSRAIELNPGFNKAYQNRAAARNAVGDRAGAKADLDRLRRLTRN